MLLKTEGIVVERREWSEASQILTLFTDRFGKLKALAKGARRPRSRHGGGCDLLDRVAIVFYWRDEGLHLVAETAVRPAAPGLRARLSRLLAALTLAETLRDCTREAEPAPALYTLACETLDRLASATQPGVVLAAFETRACAELGFAPQVDACAGCGVAIPPTGASTFSAAAGGVVCAACRADASPPVRRIGADARALLRTLAAGAVEPERLRPAPLALRQARSALAAVLRVLAERPRRSERYARDIEAPLPGPVARPENASVGGGAARS